MGRRGVVGGVRGSGFVRGCFGGRGPFSVVVCLGRWINARVLFVCWLELVCFFSGG